MKSFIIFTKKRFNFLLLLRSDEKVKMEKGFKSQGTDLKDGEDFPVCVSQ